MGITLNWADQQPATEPDIRVTTPDRIVRRILLISDQLDRPRERVQVSLLQEALADRGEALLVADWRHRQNGWSDFVDLSGLLARGMMLAQRYRDLHRTMLACDVVHIRYSDSLGIVNMAAVVGLAQYLGRPVVCDIRTHDIEAVIESVGRSEKWLFDHCTTIIVSSSYHREMLTSVGVESDVIVDMIDRSRFSARRISQVQPRLISVRPLEPENNVSGLVKAFALVKHKYPRAELTIIGDGSRRPVIESIIESERLSGITLIGEVNHRRVAELMSEADVYVNPSGLDSVPVSLLEALSSGMPVVSTDAGGIEHIITDGENGLLAPAFSPPALADRIIELVDQPELAARLSSRAPWSLGGTPWMESSVDAWCALYQRIGGHRLAARQA